MDADDEGGEAGEEVGDPLQIEFGGQQSSYTG